MRYGLGIYIEFTSNSVFHGVTNQYMYDIYMQKPNFKI